MELFVKDDDKIFKKIMHMVEKFIELDDHYFSSAGSLGIKLCRLVGSEDKSIIASSKLNTRVENTSNGDTILDIDRTAGLKIKMAKIEKMIEAVDDKTSNKAICFGNVQLYSKKETREFVANMKQPSLRGFYDIISLLDLCHAD